MKHPAETNVNPRTPENHKDAAPTVTPATHNGYCTNDILRHAFREHEMKKMSLPPAVALVQKLFKRDSI
jgi:hypothetical protein